MSFVRIDPAAEQDILRRLGVERAGTRFQLAGRVDAVCRDAAGQVVWEVHQPNVITDYGRRIFANYSFWTLSIFTSPAADTALLGRYALLDAGATNGSQSFLLATSYDVATLTKTWTTAFAAPPANRSIGTIGLAAVARAAALGMYGICAYTLISPVKTQGTLQTLEVAYRVTLTPVY